MGVVPAATRLQLGCTPPVAAQLPALVASVVAELARMGVTTRRREVALATSDDGARALGL